jgi:hypothetical protein
LKDIEADERSLLFGGLPIAGTLWLPAARRLAIFRHACEGGRQSMTSTYLLAAAFALVGRIVLGWVDAPFLIGCLIAGTVIGAVEYYYLQKDREYDERR